MRRLLSWPIMLALLTASPVLARPSGDPALALQKYYARLRHEVTLPQAAPNPALPVSTELTRMAFGSCLHQDRPQEVWDRIGALNPQMFLMIGDNVYGDTGWVGDAALGYLRESYAMLAGRAEFDRFRRTVPMMTVWDDHDFGFNDGSATFTFRAWSEEIYEHFWNSPAEVRSHPGVYQSAMFGPEGRRVQLILLDTRAFRTPIRLASISDGPTPLGRHLVDDSADARMLGEAQWRWLAGELAKPADLRLVVSSIQVLTDAHRNEGWFMMPRERERLYAALKARSGGGLLLLSGDRHRGAIYSARPVALGEEIWEFTSSSLNLPFKPGDRTADEPDPVRRTLLTGDENFGTIEIDWQAHALSLGLRDKEGRIVAEQKVEWDRRAG